MSHSIFYTWLKKKRSFISSYSKVTAKYQITLPVKIRKELGIVPGAEEENKGSSLLLTLV